MSKGFLDGTSAFSFGAGESERDMPLSACGGECAFVCKGRGEGEGAIAEPAEWCEDNERVLAPEMCDLTDTVFPVGCGVKKGFLDATPLVAA